MPKIKYLDYNLHSKTKKLIAECNKIMEEYEHSGYDLTLRQLYYQLVSRNIVSNTVASYKNVGEAVNRGRLAGHIDWNHIVDRVRNLHASPTWNHPSSIINACASQYHTSWWKNQEFYVELWVEKEALLNVVGTAAKEYDCPYFACKGFNSQSEMWSAAQRLIAVQQNRQQPVVIYCGDHDPSGLDMDRDIFQRLRMFGCDASVKRVALTWDQVQEMSLPPNPAKETDTRFRNYQIEYGDESWELDAIPPNTLVNLITDKIKDYLDLEEFEIAKEEEEAGRSILRKIARSYDEVVQVVS